MGPVVEVEEVAGGKALTRFVELPHALDGADPRFAPLVLGWERARLDGRRNPALATAELACFLARRAGRPAGRVAAWVPAEAATGHLALWWTVDDAAVAGALLDAAREWLGERGCTSVVGPLSFREDQEIGVQVAGHDVPGVTGRPWHPPHLARLLVEAGMSPLADHPTWRLPAVTGPAASPGGAPGAEVPGHAGAYGDARLVLDGVAAVPDVSPALRGSLRSALRIARRARSWDTCTVVRCDADPAAAVPALQAAAGAAGYRWVIAPWTPSPADPPETVHRVFLQRL